MRLGYSLLALATLGGGGTTFAISSKPSFSPPQQKTITTKAKAVTLSPTLNSQPITPPLSSDVLTQSQVKNQSPSLEPQVVVLPPSPQVGVSEPVKLTKPQIAESDPSPQDQGLSVVTPSLSAQEPVETAEISVPASDPAPDSLPSPQMSDSLSQTSDLPPETFDSLGKSHLEEEPHTASETLPDAIEDDVGDVGNCQFISFTPKTNIPSDFKITDEGYFSVDCKNKVDNILSSYDWIGFFPKSFFGINWRNIENKRISIQIEDKEDLVTDEEEDVHGIKISSPKLLGSTFVDAKLTYHSWEGEGNWTKIEPTSKKDQKIYLLLKEEGAGDEA